MYIREAVPEDNYELQKLQAQCPQGKSLIVSTVNTPDFFARVKAYESYKVYLACEGSIIVGSGACAIREAMINRKVRRIGYEFQYFTSPDYRKAGIAKQLRQQIEDHLIQSGVQLSYALIMEGNLPSMRLFEGEGFKQHRTLVMPALAVRKGMKTFSEGNIRPAKARDLTRIAELLNTTWNGRDLYEPTSAETLARLIHRLPTFSHDSSLKSRARYWLV
jgi:GNAT superfamily N-acetyltransferase